MSAEQAQRKEPLGIHVPLAPTIIQSTFTNLHKGPHGEAPYVDVKNGRSAVWLTSPDPDDPDVHLVIGPDGRSSAIGVTWTEIGPIFLRNTPSGYEPIGFNPREDVEVVNLPPGERAFVASKQYPGHIEEYTVFQVPQEGQTVTQDAFAPFIGQHQLMSGINKRGLKERFLTSFLGIRITDKSELPYGRELKSTTY